ncbi:amidohydrolase family protein [Actinospica durhamensis]|uniref:Amidohydrolase family protein n=1 Tax=Actinospica durhamensis TaxID=1508375 RepID=A0A941EXF4_9ACTN|nr:amidohydrolase family protein [Actinospica durhamensis]MBR7838102.1 amidohydrolase family protein [Actinospica durhamensis]
MTVDAHHHLWDLHVRAHEWLRAPDFKPIWRDFGLEELEAQARDRGVDKTILVQVAASADETREFLAYAACTTLIAGVVGWMDLTADDPAEDLARISGGAGGQRLVGIRHLVQDEPDPDWLDRPEVRRGIGAVGAAGLPYDILVRAPQTQAALRLVRESPDQVFVLDHLGKPPIAEGDLEPWAGWIQAMAAQPNVVCKLSGLVTEADWGTWTVPDLRPYTDIALEAFGPDRLMFGSDWPVCVLAGSYGEVFQAATDLTSELSTAERAAVFGATATRVYGI